jgi:hypothetical protein
VDVERLWLFLGAGASLLAAFRGVQAFVRTLARRRRQRHLEEAGLTAVAQVATVEPMQRSVNDAAGHPVTVTFQAGAGGPRTFRDPTGLGGYLVREGAQVVVRYSPTDPELVRTEEIVGGHGRYPVRPDGRVRLPSLAGPVVTVVVGGWFAGVLALVASGRLAAPDPPARVVGGLFAVVGAVMLVGAAAVAVRGLRARSRPRGEAVGVVTEVWTEEDSRVSYRHGPRILHRFTVHFATEDGREVHMRNRSATGSFRPQQYQQVRVRYDRAHPVRFEVRELGGAHVLMAMILVGMGGIFLTVGTVLWFAFSGTGN